MAALLFPATRYLVRAWGTVMLGPVNPGAWRLVQRTARELERAAGRLTGERARVARLAVMVLEGVASKLLGGTVTRSDLERLEELEALLRIYGLPTGPVERVRRIVLEAAEIVPSMPPGSEALGGIIVLA